MKKCKIIGLTGQSGAGKSTVANYFEENNIKVINADVLVHKIYDSTSPCLKAVSAVFGNDIIMQDGSLDRKLLAKRAFCSKENTDVLSSIVHPFVVSQFLAELKYAVANKAKVVVFDAPQLFESNADVICDLIVSVLADDNIRIKRICRRDNISEELAKMRINVQLSEEFFRENSDYILENNSDVDTLKNQFEKLLNYL